MWSTTIIRYIRMVDYDKDIDRLSETTRDLEIAVAVAVAKLDAVAPEAI